MIQRPILLLFNLRAMWVCGSVLILPHGTCERKKESFFTQSTYRYLKYRCRTLVSVESCFCNSSTDTHRIAAQCRQRHGWREGEERDIAREREGEERGGEAAMHAYITEHVTSRQKKTKKPCIGLLGHTGSSITKRKIGFQHHFTKKWYAFPTQIISYNAASCRKMD